MAKLTLDDIADLRAYERERAEFRQRIIELKRVRRVHVGTIVTLVFENRDTIRFQIQEMARVEKIISDEGIAAELRAYNPLIPEPGQLSATLFIELTSKEQLVEWLPKLVGIERSVELRLGHGADVDVVRCVPEESHEEQLTRDDITASVHYIRFELTPQQVERVASGPVVLAVAHPAYRDEVELGEATRASLLRDLRGEA
ncbi:MAG: DUF3501 family protein [Acidimicrobiales bacterium]|nr:DUF3501 family protein [Acidimicrobiales bacterium]